MKISRTVRAIAMISAAVMVGCAGDIHESEYEERNVAPRERVVREDPPPRYESQQYDQPQHEQPQYDSSRSEQPQYAQPQYDAQRSEQPQYDPPRYDRGQSNEADIRTEARAESDRPVYRDDAPPPEASRDYRDDRPVDVDVVAEEPDYASGEDVRYFEDDLRPYGDWVVTAEFGRCFHPHGISAEWRPYSQGHWCNTDDGWLWASEEPHGWATYHYGRWTEDSRYGWCWVPGRTWAPAWVTWRHGGGNVGWAPIPPHRHGSSLSISVEIGRIH